MLSDNISGSICLAPTLSISFSIFYVLIRTAFLLPIFFYALYINHFVNLVSSSFLSIRILFFIFGKQSSILYSIFSNTLWDCIKTSLFFCFTPFAITSCQHLINLLITYCTCMPILCTLCIWTTRSNYFMICCKHSI